MGETERRNIVLKGGREHNLQNIDLTIPRDKFVVVTGLSGSGKSTLALTLFMLKDSADMWNHCPLMQDSF